MVRPGKSHRWIFKYFLKLLVSWYARFLSSPACPALRKRYGEPLVMEWVWKTFGHGRGSEYLSLQVEGVLITSTKSWEGYWDHVMLFTLDTRYPSCALKWWSPPKERKADCFMKDFVLLQPVSFIDKALCTSLGMNSHYYWILILGCIGALGIWTVFGQI